MSQTCQEARINLTDPWRLGQFWVCSRIFWKYVESRLRAIHLLLTIVLISDCKWFLIKKSLFNTIFETQGSHFIRIRNWFLAKYWLLCSADHQIALKKKDYPLKRLRNSFFAQNQALNNLKVFTVRLILRELLTLKRRTEQQWDAAKRSGTGIFSSWRCCLALLLP